MIPVLQLPSGGAESIGTGFELPPAPAPIIPVLQMPLPGSNSLSLSATSVKIDTAEEVTTTCDNTTGSVLNDLFHSQHARERAADRSGGSDNSDNAGNDIDSKRRRVPAINFTHQSPRTLEMFQNMQK